MSTGLRLHSLSFGYGRRNPVLSGLDLQLSAGRSVLLGPNGAGKSTLSKLLAGVVKPIDGGVILPGSQSLASVSELQRHVGYMPQDVRPIPGLRVVEQVAYSAWLAGLPQSKAQARAAAAVERVGLADRAKKSAAQLSGGQLRRVGLAQVLATSPSFLILDEPTAGLDPAQRASFRAVLGSLDLEWGVLVVTHQVDDLTASYSDVVVLDQGEVRFQGTPAQFLSLSPEGPDAAYLTLVEGEQ